MTRGTIAALAAALLLTACGGDKEVNEANCQDPNITDEMYERCLDKAREIAREELAKESEGAAEPQEPTQEAPALEGPAMEPGVLPSGVTVEIVRVISHPVDWAAEDYPDHDTEVQIRVRLSSGPDGYPLNQVDGFGGPGGTLLYGPNRTEANGWYLEQERPTLITEESPVELVESFTLPADGLSELRYIYSPAQAEQEPWTFTDVEELL
jgi:hypothetical protein